MSADDRGPTGDCRASHASVTVDDRRPEVVRHETELSAESEPALSARLSLLAEALRLRGGRLVTIRHHRQRKARVSASVAYELPALGAGRAVEPRRLVL